MFHITLYSRPGCHLCDSVEQDIRRVGNEVPLQLEVIDIRTSVELEEKYLFTIPVVMIDGEEVFVSITSVMSESELRAELERRKKF